MLRGCRLTALCATHWKAAIAGRNFFEKWQSNQRPRSHTWPIPSFELSISTKALMDLAGKVQFPKIYQLKTGLSAWKAAKKPIESIPLPGVGRLAPGKKPTTPKAK